MAQEGQQISRSASPPSPTRVSHEKSPSPSQDMSLIPPVEPFSETSATQATSNTGPPPNSGVTAWLQVLGSFLLFFNTWGLLNTFGVFQTYYESGVLFTESSSNIAWSICKTYRQVLLAQGFVIGIGAGCLFVPCVAVLPAYFSTNLGLAVGIASSSSSLGGVIYPIVLYQLIDKKGFGWSVRVVAFIALGTLLIPIAVMEMRVKPPKARALADWSAFTDWSWGLFTFATFLGFTGIAIILFYISYYAQDQHITDTKMAFYVVPILNAASCLGRVLPNALADQIGPFNIMIPGSCIFGTLALCMMAVKSEAAITILATLTGLFSGVYLALPPICFVALTEDKTKIGSRLGMGYGIIAFGMLAGGPGGGKVLGVIDPLNWNGLWIFTGVVCLASSLLYAGLRVARYGPKIFVKA